MPEWHQLVCMSGHVKESETTKILQLYAASMSTSVSTRLYLSIYYIYISVVGLVILHDILFATSTRKCTKFRWYPGGATYIPLHVVITDQTLSFFTQNTDMPKDWKVTLTTDLLWKKDTHIADHSPGANKDTQITDLKSRNNPFHWWWKALGEKLKVIPFTHMCSTIEHNPDVSFYSAECSLYSSWTSTHLLHKRGLLVLVRD